MNGSIISLMLAVAALLGVVFCFALMATILPVWLRAFLSGAPVQAITIVGMRLRGNPAKLLVDAYIALRHSRVDVSISEVESTYLANRVRVLNSADLVSLVAAKSTP